jgi:hypothetical protein
LEEVQQKIAAVIEFCELEKFIKDWTLGLENWSSQFAVSREMNYQKSATCKKLLLVLCLLLEKIVGLHKTAKAFQNLEKYKQYTKDNFK